MIKEDVKPRDIITKKAIDDAFALDMAMGGSTNTVLHTLAIANEAGIEYDLADINKIAAKTPYLAKIMPASDISMDDRSEERRVGKDCRSCMAVMYARKKIA